MKIVNLFKQELKTKWSSRLLVTLVVVLVASVFGSSFLLKREYDLVEKEPQGRFQGYKKLVNQSFTHIKAKDGQLLGQIQFETGNEASVFVKERDKDLTKWANNIFVKNDTLFLDFDRDATNKMNEYGSRTVFVCITAPNIQSIVADNSHITADYWGQKSMTVSLSNGSFFEIESMIDSMKFCKISLFKASNFNIDDYKLNKKKVDIQLLEADLKDSCALHLGGAIIKNFKLNATEGNKIELSSETMNVLMKK